MARLNNTDSFKLHGWMVNDLGLGGGELITFALVYQMTTSKYSYSSAIATQLS